MKKQSLFVLLFIFASNAFAQQTCQAYISNLTPNSRYTVDILNRTVLDNQTGLMWQRCSLGQTGTNCTGTASEITWQSALQAGVDSTVGGFTDWRLPNKKELSSITAYHCFNPSVNETVFPNTVPLFYWSSSTTFGGNTAVVVHFDNGRDGIANRTSAVHVRLVR